jgi:hypothetical protein
VRTQTTDQARRWLVARLGANAALPELRVASVTCERRVDRLLALRVC